LYVLVGWILFEDFVRKIPWQQHGHLFRKGPAGAHSVSLLFSVTGDET
jgi:hypothetical protein